MVAESLTLLLGSPLFDIHQGSRPYFAIPVGEVPLARKVLASAPNPLEREAGLAAEYRALVETLLAGQMPFRVLNPDAGTPAMARWLAERGCARLDFDYPGTGYWVRYPRDLFVLLEPVATLLVNPGLFRIDATERRGYRILHSPWGEGGRVLLSGDCLLVGADPQQPQLPDAPLLDALRERGMRIAAIPQGLFQDLAPAAQSPALFGDAHIDRVASLLRDRAGAAHLLLSAGYRSGPASAPWSAQRSLDEVRRACAPLEIEVHQPRSRFPYGASVVQLPDGRVLGNAGDTEVNGLLAQLVGTRGLLLTPRPLRHYPLFARAGLHCLVTESPVPLIAPLGSG